MNKYKILFSDIDGTILTSNHKVSEVNKEYINKLKKADIPVILVSARMPDGIYKVQRDLNIDYPIICYGGALVLDSSKNIVMSKGIKLEKVFKLKNYINTMWPDVCVSCYSFDNWYVDTRDNEWVNQESAITSIKPVEKDIKKLSSDKENVIHKVLCMGKPESIQNMKEKFEELNLDFSIYKSKDTYLEITDLQVKKSNAIIEVCDLYNVNLSEIVSVGDNFNDIDMIKLSGLGIAMGNAPKEVKEISDDITKTNDEDGVAEVIKTYLL